MHTFSLSLSLYPFHSPCLLKRGKEIITAGTFLFFVRPSSSPSSSLLTVYTVKMSTKVLTRQKQITLTGSAQMVREFFSKVQLLNPGHKHLNSRPLLPHTHPPLLPHLIMGNVLFHLRLLNPL